MSKLFRAGDGLRARDNGTWAELKLSFLDEFCPVALAVTERKRDRYYVDLFAGPGKNIDSDSGREFEGSPLRILRTVGSNTAQSTFDRAIFVNDDRLDHEALTTRVTRAIVNGSSRLTDNQVATIRGDANDLLPKLMASIPVQAYVLVFADIEGPSQWPWTSVRALKSTGHQSVDLYTLFPLDMAINRLLSWKGDRRRQFADLLTTYFGTDEWSPINDRRLTPAHSPEFRRHLENLYVRQLKTLWPHAGTVVDVYRTGKHRLYKMMFASAHPAAARISTWAAAELKRRQNLDLFT